MAGNNDAVAEDFGDEGTLVVEDQRFAIVPEWVITAEVSDAAFRAYTILLRFGGTSGCRMPSRALLARRLHRSVDSVDRALPELRRPGRSGWSDGNKGTSSSPTATTSGPPRLAPEVREPGVAANLRPIPVAARPYPERSTHRAPPPGDSAAHEGPDGSASAVRTADDELLQACGISDMDDLSRQCMARGPPWGSRPHAGHRNACRWPSGWRW